jgi:drug/metabolite transporter (DMT)-like permease
MSRPALLPLPALALLFNALVWGVAWWPFRQLNALGLHPLWSIVVIYLLGAAGIAAWRPQALRQILAPGPLWILAACSGITNAAFNWAVSIGEVVRVVLLFYLMPLWTVLLARVVLHERITWHAGLRVALALAGAAIVLRPPGTAWPLPQGLPDGLGLLGGFSFALNGVVLRRVAHRTHEEGRAVAMLLGCVTVAAVMGSLMASRGLVPWPPPPQPGWVLAAVGLGGVFMASNLAYQFGAARLPANVTSVVMLTEVVFATISAVWWGGEALHAHMLLGGALILAAALLAVIGPTRFGRRPAA